MIIDTRQHPGTTPETVAAMVVNPFSLYVYWSLQATTLTALLGPESGRLGSPATLCLRCLWPEETAFYPEQPLQGSTYLTGLTPGRSYRVEAGFSPQAGVFWALRCASAVVLPPATPAQPTASLADPVPLCLDMYFGRS